MNCEETQDLILTDYSDGQMSREQAARLEAHLAVCPHCGEFKDAAGKAVFEPLRNAEKVVPPESVWLKIKGQIGQEQQAAEGSISPLADRLRSFFLTAKPLYAAATALAILLAVTLLVKSPLQNGSVPTVNLEEEIEYVATLMEGTNQGSGQANGGFGTSIEEYFL